mmetsp:Transcript_35470/g.92729  ORF Transcript_35470/g.92729 Transcript_35470/m.92729 type:complete len:207 (-) Transcript_35470:194-814(-)
MIPATIRTTTNPRKYTARARTAFNLSSSNRCSSKWPAGTKFLSTWRHGVVGGGTSPAADSPSTEVRTSTGRQLGGASRSRPKCHARGCPGGRAVAAPLASAAASSSRPTTTRSISAAVTGKPNSLSPTPGWRWTTESLAALRRRLGCRWIWASGAMHFQHMCMARSSMGHTSSAWYANSRSTVHAQLGSPTQVSYASTQATLHTPV